MWYGNCRLLDILCNLSEDRPNHHLKMKTIWLKFMYGNKDDIKTMILNLLVGLSLTFLDLPSAYAISKVDFNIDYHKDTTQKRLIVEYYPNRKVRLKATTAIMQTRKYQPTIIWEHGTTTTKMGHFNSQSITTMTCQAKPLSLKRNIIRMGR